MTLFKVWILVFSIASCQAGFKHQDLVRYEESFKPYDFGYKVSDGFGTTLDRQENSDGSGTVTGYYGYTDPNGVYRHVQYRADAGGFSADVNTNEPGTANQNPADVNIHSEDPPDTVVQQTLAPSLLHPVPSVTGLYGGGYPTIGVSSFAGGSLGSYYTAGRQTVGDSARDFVDGRHVGGGSAGGFVVGGRHAAGGSAGGFVGGRHAAGGSAGGFVGGRHVGGGSAGGFAAGGRHAGAGSAGGFAVGGRHAGDTSLGGFVGGRHAAGGSARGFAVGGRHAAGGSAGGFAVGGRHAAGGSAGGFAVGGRHAAGGSAGGFAVGGRHAAGGSEGGFVGGHHLAGGSAGGFAVGGRHAAGGSAGGFAVGGRHAAGGSAGGFAVGGRHAAGVSAGGFAVGGDSTGGFTVGGGSAGGLVGGLLDSGFTLSRPVIPIGGSFGRVFITGDVNDNFLPSHQGPYITYRSPEHKLAYAFPGTANVVSSGKTYDHHY